MAYNISALKVDLSGVLHGTTISQITGIDNLIYRAARQLLLDVDPQETKRTVEFSSPIFNGVTDYAIAADVKGNKLIDIMPQVNRIPRDVWSQQYNQAFDVMKQNIFSTANMFTMNFNTGLKTIKINAPYINPPVIIDTISAISSNGTWAVSQQASNLTVNNTNYVYGAGSLQFDVAAAGVGTLSNTTMAAIDLIASKLQSSFFVWVYVPTGGDLLRVDLLIGSSNSDFYSFSVTSNQQGTAFVNGWNLCQFIWANYNGISGTPDVSKITYAAININLTPSSATAIGVKINLLESVLGLIMNYEYYSKYLFRSATTGAFQETVTDDSNLINLDTETYNLLFNLTASIAIQQQQGLDATFYDGPFFEKKYQDGEARYKMLYKSELQKPQTTYYRTPDVSNSRYIGRRFNY